MQQESLFHGLLCIGWLAIALCAWSIPAHAFQTTKQCQHQRIICQTACRSSYRHQRRQSRLNCRACYTKQSRRRCPRRTRVVLRRRLQKCLLWCKLELKSCLERNKVCFQQHTPRCSKKTVWMRKVYLVQQQQCYVWKCVPPKYVLPIVVCAGGKSPSPTGPTRKAEEMAQVIRRHQKTVRRCYNLALQRKPGLKGQLVVRLGISPSGKVKSWKLEKDQIRVSWFTRCIRRVMKRWRFPQGSSLDFMIVPFNFEMENP